MVTEEQKKNRQIELVNSVMFGLGKGLYDVLGDSTMRVMAVVGQHTLCDMENRIGREVKGGDAGAILAEVGRILVDEYGVLSAFEPSSLGGTLAQVICTGCLFKPASIQLRDADIPAHTCIPESIITAALRNRLHVPAHIIGIEVSDDHCVLTGDIAG